MSTTDLTFHNVLFAYVLPGLAACAVIANTVELFLIFKSKQHRNGKVIVFLINLALSNFFVGFLMIASAVLRHLIKTTRLGDSFLAVEIYSFIQKGFIRLLLFVSVFTLIPMSIDRVRAVRTPFSYRNKSKAFDVIVVFGIWALGVTLTTIVYLLTATPSQHTNKYINLVFVVPSMVSAVVFGICYLTILFYLKQSRSSLDNANRASTNQNTKHQTLLSAQEMHFLYVAVKRVSVFLLCWLPLSISSLVHVFDPTMVSVNARSVFFIMAYSSTVINPLTFICQSVQMGQICFWLKKRNNSNTSKLVQPKKKVREYQLSRAELRISSTES